MSFWRLSDGTEPALRCDACAEPTPITTHGLCPFCDSGRLPKGEDAPAAECAASQSGPAQTGHRPNPKQGLKPSPPSPTEEELMDHEGQTDLRRPFMVEPAISQHEVALASAKLDMLVDDVTQIVQRVPFIEVAPARLWEPGLIAEFADAVDRLSVKLAKLQEAQGADR